MSQPSGEARPEPVGVQIPELADASGLFASRLYAELASKQDRGFNVVFSPLSVHLALSMTLAGAAGSTREAMMKTLGIRDEKHEKALWQDVSRLMAFVDMNANGGEKQIDLAIANRMYLQSEHQPAEAFLEVAREHFHSDAQQADFVGNAEGERVKINQFVSEATKGLINELLAKGSLDAHSRMVIVNAIYFKGQWKSQFDKALTKPRDFKGFEGKEVTSVQMMHSKDHKYFGSPDTKVGATSFASLRIAYHGGYSMFFLLPENSAAAVSALEKELQNLGATAFLNQVSQAQRQNKYAAVMIPRCRLEYSVDLTAALKATGMEIAFSDSAEFNMIKSAQPLKISSVVHKAFMQLDEEGTTAAAATAVGLRAMCAVAAPLQPLEFIADHPFLAILAHDATHTPLFVAKVTRPIDI